MSIRRRKANKMSLKDRSAAINKAVGARIRTLRLKQPEVMSQRELGDKVGRNFAQISRIENGDTAADPPILLAIAEVLGCKPGDLLNGIAV